MGATLQGVSFILKMVVYELAGKVSVLEWMDRIKKLIYYNQCLVLFGYTKIVET